MAATYPTLNPKQAAAVDALLSGYSPRRADDSSRDLPVLRSALAGERLPTSGDTPGAQSRLPVLRQTYPVLLRTKNDLRRAVDPSEELPVMRNDPSGRAFSPDAVPTGDERL